MKLLELMGFEYKKMWKRKSLRISVTAVLILLLAVGALGVYGTVYIVDELTVTQSERIKLEREEGKTLDGLKLTDEQFLEAKKQQEEYSLVPFTSSNFWDIQKQYMSSRLISELSYRESDKLETHGFYSQKLPHLKDTWNSKNLSEPEKDYLEKQYLSQEQPWTYAYNEAYKRFSSLQITTLIMLSLVIVICLSPLFAEEYSTRMDALMLSSKHGRKKTFLAKILVGLSFTFVITLVGFSAVLAEQIFIYGSGNLSAPMQSMNSFSDYVYHFTAGQLVLLTFVCGLLGMLFLSVFIMLCSACMKSSFGPVIIGILLTFLPMFTSIIPDSWHTLWMAANSLPGNFGLAASFMADQLLVLFGRAIPSFVYIPVIYVILSSGFFWISKRGYLRRQPV